MNKQIFCMLLCGAMVLSTGVFVSCEDNNKELESRMTVIEGMLRDLQQQLDNLPGGAGVTNATQSPNGTWTLTLSTGQVITITPGGGADITVTETNESITITINGTAYVLPKVAAAFSLIYAPEYVDGQVVIGSDAHATVSLLVKPALTSATLAKAEFVIAAANELKLRAGDDVLRFRIGGNVTLDGDYITVPLRAVNIEANKIYAVAIQMNLNGGVYVSNFFNVTSQYEFSAGEEIITPDLVSAVTDYTELDSGFSTATLPEATVDFLGAFNFKDLFKTLPEGTVEFSLGPKARQNANVQNRYDFFASCLSANGTWTMQGRPGTNGDAPAGDANPSGLLIYVTANDILKAKIYWKIVDPLKNVDFVAGLAGLVENHMEYPETIVWEKGAGKFNLNKAFVDGDFQPKHGSSDKFYEAWGKFEVTLKDPGDIIYNEGEGIVLGELGAKYAKFSRGIYWLYGHTSLVASQRRNLDDEAKGNGETIGGYDPIPENEMWSNYGIRITEGGFIECSAAYGGHAFRAGPRLRYEYAYGEKHIGGEGKVIAFVFFNRRVSPPGVIDPTPR